MATRLYDFQCSSCLHRQEEFISEDTREVACEYCGAPSMRIVSPVRTYLDGTDPGFPGAYDKWGRDFMKRMDAAKKREEQ